MFETLVETALRRRTELDIDFQDVGVLVEALTNAYKARCTQDSLGAVIRDLPGAMTFVCAGCRGVLKSDAVITGATVRSIQNMNPQMSTLLGGPNIAALVAGQCPGCGGRNLHVVYDPENLAKWLPPEASRESAGQADPTRETDAAVSAVPCLKHAAFFWSGNPPEMQAVLRTFHMLRDGMPHFAYGGFDESRILVRSIGPVDQWSEIVNRGADENAYLYFAMMMCSRPGHELTTEQTFNHMTNIWLIHTMEEALRSTFGFDRSTSGTCAVFGTLPDCWYAFVLDRPVDVSQGIFNRHSGETLAELFAEIDMTGKPENARIAKAYQEAILRQHGTRGATAESASRPEAQRNTSNADTQSRGCFSVLLLFLSLAACAVAFTFLVP
jgi:hypothetical protein